MTISGNDSQAGPPAPHDDAAMSYRASHLAEGKGEAYDRRFSETPHRSLVWELEKRALDDILSTYLGGQTIDHLDFACGTGRILRHIEARTRTSVGVDVSGSMLSVAQRQCHRSELIQADLTESDVLGERTFNLITAFRFFPNAETPLRTAAMAVMVRHLAPGGCIVFNNHLNTSSAFVALVRLFRMGTKFGMSGSDVERLVEGAGLNVAGIYHIGILPSNDRYLILPLPVVRAVESWAMQRPALRRVSQNLIYVCRKGHSR